MNQIEQIQEQNKHARLIEKATAIAAANRVRKTSNRNIWTVGSGNAKTPSKWYAVSWDEDLGIFLCDCPAYTYCPVGNTDQPYCCHLLAVAIFESNND
jgi:hypothetical protein